MQKPLTTYTVKLTDGDKITIKAHEVSVSHDGLMIGFTIHDGNSRSGSGWVFPSCNVLYVVTEDALRNMA